VFHAIGTHLTKAFSFGLAPRSRPSVRRPAARLLMAARLPNFIIHNSYPYIHGKMESTYTQYPQAACTVRISVHSYINSSIQWRHREKAWWCGHLTRPSRASLDTRRKKLFQLMGSGTPFLENSLSFHSFSCPATTSETAK